MRRFLQSMLAVTFAGTQLLGAAAWAKPTAKKSNGPQPVARISLADVGAPGVSARFLELGASIFTLNLLDAQHMLVTYAAKSLVRRTEGSTKDSDDRNIEAVVVQLPSGHVLAKTEWMLHDHARYLWPVGEGRFVIRIGNELALISPLERLGTTEPFLRVALPRQPGVALGAVSSPDGKIMAVIRQLPPEEQKGPVVTLGNGADNRPKPEYLVNYVRLGEKSTMSSSATVKVAIPLSLPLDSDGYLWAEEGNPNHWAVSFNVFGQPKEIAAGKLESPCPPKLRLMSNSEYLAMTCQGLNQGMRLMSLGFDGHETWEEDFPAMSQVPSFVSAPEAGRFAMSFETDVPTGQMATNSLPGQANAQTETHRQQELRVYGTESGDLLLKLAVAPVFHTPENFDLSADGRTLAVLVGDEIQVYDLPAPSARDVADRKEIAAFAPPSVGDAKVDLSRLAAAPQAVTASVSTPTSTTTAAAVAVPSAAAVEKGTMGDAVVPGLRKKPSLLNPGEEPEFKDKNAPPK
ncbi:MAG: hypothetical protein PW792_11235 [Acidobacteriaceae bacterium]|nr:hypothetical protein [Acidobacteriaceae bacterium]